MSKKYYFIFSILFFLALGSCSDLKKDSRIEQIVKMEKSLDSLDKELKLLKIDSLENMQLAAQMVELRIKNNLKSDSVDIEFGKKMDSYKRMRRAIPKFQRNLVKLNQGIKEMRGSLTDLKSDIKNSNGKREKYDEYITFEKKKLNQLEVLMKEMQTSLKKIVDTYSMLHQELYTFSMSLIPNQ